MTGTDQVKAQLDQARSQSTQGLALISRQRLVIEDLEARGCDTSTAEAILDTMLATQRLLEEFASTLEQEVRQRSLEGRKASHAAGNVPPPQNRGNRILASLPQDEFSTIQPYLERTELRPRQRLQTVNRKLDAVYFLDSGLAAVMTVTSSGGHQAHVGLVGCGGMTGFAFAFGSAKSHFDVRVEVRGQAQRISTSNLVHVLDHCPTARSAVLHYLEQAWLRFAFAAALNAQGTIEQRAACLLLLAQDCLDCSDVPLTHEQLSEMLSVRRSGVTVALQSFEDAKLVAKRRGVVTILDGDGLWQRARHVAPRLASSFNTQHR